MTIERVRETDNVLYPWTPVDPLAEALHLLRMRGGFYCRSELTAPWALEMPPVADSVSFHLSSQAKCGSRSPIRRRRGSSPENSSSCRTGRDT